MSGTKQGAKTTKSRHGDDFYSRNALKANSQPRKRGFDSNVVARLAAIKRHAPADYAVIVSLRPQGGSLTRKQAEVLNARKIDPAAVRAFLLSKIT